MSQENKIIDPALRPLVDELEKTGPVKLGPFENYMWRHDPKHVLFTLSRYKFCAKMLSGFKKVLEVGCGDGMGAAIMLQEVGEFHGVDIEQYLVDFNLHKDIDPDRHFCKLHDILTGSYDIECDGVISLDVIEHIPPEKENLYLKNLAGSLRKEGVCIIGTPNITSQVYAGPYSIESHINLKDHKTLKESALKHFYNVFIFSMNDEVVHTGFYPMAHYLFALCVGPRDK